MNLFNTNKKPKRVFLDYASTTPIAPEVLESMKLFEASNFANPSALYTEALRAKEALAEARGTIADILGGVPEEVVFTSGGTEGNNLAILGVFESARKEGIVPHMITTSVEHPSVLEVFEEVKRRGGTVTVLQVNEDGRVSPKDVADAIQLDTVLVSVMYANNEIGTVEPIKEIGRTIKEHKRKTESVYPYFHTDASQASLYLPLNVHSLAVDLVTFDGIKMYGPRGAGILYVKSKTKISPILFGGGQEGGLRSGTENVAASIGLAAALRLAEEKKEQESERLVGIRNHLISEILREFPQAKLNASSEFRLPNNVNVCFPGLDAEFAVISLDVAGISASYSSSCRTLKEDSSSYVIEGIGRKECKESSLRFTFGRETTLADITFLLSALRNIIK